MKVIPSSRLPITDNQLSITAYQLQLTAYRLSFKSLSSKWEDKREVLKPSLLWKDELFQITNYQLPITA